MKQEERYYHECLIDIVNHIENDSNTDLIITKILTTKEELHVYGNRGLAILIDSFLDALYTRVKDTNKEHEHIYLKAFETPQIILFETLIQNFPPVALTQKTITSFIANRVVNKRKITLMDIGIGTGQQVLSIIGQIQALNPNIEEITILGIEPSLDSLKIAANHLEGYKSRGLKINVVLINEFAEKIKVENIQQLITEDSECLIINASFALHHIKTIADRQYVFQQLRKLQPDLLLLTEPNIDHYTPNLMERFLNCFHHFKVNFGIIDGQPIQEKEQQALKHFFCREIKDIIGNSEKERVEKHTLTKDWVSMLKMVDFTPIKITPNTVSDNQFQWHDEGYLGFGTNEETLIGVVAVESSN